ncbi:S-DNA-T family DNA segregation ATPase FtsK/SpoIIIE [Natranaerovirga pectinivora]|uniref:S-DNA-T family DNA segregation ATPase FtsK/SpoIIIE n=1 Tax=Natranaerovirga pectinivora TaxID=682400 RepID=A0A4R3MKF0_9FIRM|nr:DNA translocase FtsK [Natranaerovirga pectinivora]TCT15037.1 S-DNA-T family DNA segregation ATPase FtsK/SpoIIIE [Natranaerovirga pectinivora]
MQKKPVKKKPIKKQIVSKGSKGSKVKKDKKEKSIFSDEITLVIVIAIALLLFISIYTIRAGVVGNAINKVIFGLIGFTAYIIPFYLIFITIFKLANKSSQLAKRKVIFSSLLLLVVTIFMQITQGIEIETFRNIYDHFTYSSSTKEGGGLIGGMIGQMMILLFGRWGTYIVLSCMVIVLMILLTEKSFVKLVNKVSKSIYNYLNKQVKNNKIKKEENKEKKSFTIEHYQEVDGDSNEEEKKNKKELSYASLDQSNMLERVTMPENIEQLTMPMEEVSAVEANKAEGTKKEETATTTLEISKENIVGDYNYEFPPIELLQKGKINKTGNSKQLIIDNANKLQQTLENFGVKVNILNVSCGPTVTRYELQPEQGVKVSRIVSLMDDIKLNLAASDLRIEAPIPGKAAIGIEVPNVDNQPVLLRDLIETDDFDKYPSSLAFSVGKDIAGKVVIADIGKMPHLLVAGATGSGKSVCINTLITSIIYKAKPSDVKLIMIDPKMVELSVYNGIPHLLIPVVTDPKKASSALNWAVAEMTDRYKKFAEYNVRDLNGYNEKVREMEDENELPKIVIIVDELADLMMVAPGEVEDAICRLAQMARAAGIHLVIATQRPSVNVITGVIKANIPSRIAFSVSSGTDSRTIIDMNGAEKLLGKGDMLFYPVGYTKPLRIQGAFISDKEVSNIVEFVKNNQEDANYNEQVIEKISSATVEQSYTAEEKDEFFDEAVKLVAEKEKASISMFQRIFRIGFNRASRLMDQLHEAGIVGPDEGSKPRKVLKSMADINSNNESY